jgi:gamma-glutamyltranspeptidase / glutathione hydrolase
VAKAARACDAPTQDMADHDDGADGGMVATSEREATDAGLAILRAGGNAADAAVAAAAALAVVEPMATGIGGDCFALYYDARTREVTALNGSGRAPAQLTIALATSRGLTEIPMASGLAVTVPGTVAGWCDLLARHGRRTIADVLAPAIDLAEDGFVVAPRNAAVWALAARRLQGGELLVDGRAPGAGERFANPGLARALRGIAAAGRDAFYLGPLAEAVVRADVAAGGVLALADLRAHRSTWDEPISIDYRGHRIWECPPNGQGITALMALGILSGFELASLDPLGPARLHLVAEALRLAFADARAFVGDPRSADVPIAELLSPAYADARRARIDPRRAMRDVPHGMPRGSDTVYLCVVDGDGNACSFINSNFYGFGSGIVPEGCGFVLQNRGASFSLDPAHPDALAPGKRPYHTIIPGMITRPDGALVGPFGVMGGYMQPQGHVQVVTAMLDDGASPQAALDRPRVRVSPAADSPLWPTAGRAVSLLLEAGIPPATADALRALGHAVVPGVGGDRVTAFGRGQIIRRAADGTLDGGSDPRADGYAGRG